eukprot:171447-Pyramimonas_sp.AAC.2
MPLALNKRCLLRFMYIGKRLNCWVAGMLQACLEGLRSIGRFVAEDFVAIVKGRNQVAKKLGFEDFYDYKVPTTAHAHYRTLLPSRVTWS